MLRRAALLLLLLPVLAGTAAAAERTVLENGLTVILDPRRTAPAVDVSAFVRAGRLFEPPHLAGATHFVEHMMFRATGRRPEGGSEREVWRNGGLLNACTRQDFTEYGILVPSERLALALDILSDALRSAEFRPEEVEEERRVVLEEVRKRKTTPETWAFEELSGMTFLPHPYGTRIIGSERSVSSISRDTLYAFYRAHYRPSRTVVVLVGDFEREEALAAVRRAFGDWKGVGSAPDAPPEPPAGFGTYQEMAAGRPGASPIVFAALAMPPYLHPDYLPSRFVRELLEGWLTQRMVVDLGIALTADAFYTPLALRNLLRIRITLPGPEQAAPARDALIQLLREMSAPEFDLQGVSEAAAHFTSREALLAEDFQSLAGVIGRAELCGYYEEDGLPEHLAAADRYTRITREDVARVIRTYCRPETMRVLFLLPPGAETPPPPAMSIVPSDRPFPETPPVRRISFEEAAVRPSASGEEPPDDGDATLTVLPSGVRLIHLERTGAPVVSGAIVLPAGSRYDPKGLEGLASLTQRTLSLATADDERGELLWRLYTMGNTYRFSVDRDSARLHFTVPREHAREALAIFAEALRNPAFNPEAVEEARGRLLRQASLAEERVSSFAGRAFRRAVFGESPYAHESYGSTASLRRIRRPDILEFYRSRYRFDRAVVALVGEIPPRTARNLVGSAFDDVEPSETQPANAPPGKAERCERSLTHPSGRPYLVLGGAAPAIGEALHAEATLLRLVLGWQTYEEFTDVRSTAYEAGSFYDYFGQAGAFGLYVSSSPEHAEEAKSVLTGIVDTAMEKGFPEDLVSDARGSWLGGLALTSVRSANVAVRMARREAAGAGYASLDEMRDRVRAITPAELRSACRRLFPPDRRVLISVR